MIAQAKPGSAPVSRSLLHALAAGLAIACFDASCEGCGEAQRIETSAPRPALSPEERAIRAFIAAADPRDLDDILLSPRPGGVYHRPRRPHGLGYGNPPEVAQWIQSVGGHPEDAHVRLLGMVWDVLRRESPLGAQLRESDGLLDTIPIRHASLRGRAASEVVTSLNEQTAAALAQRRQPPERLRVVVAAAADSGPCADLLLDLEPHLYPERVPSGDSTISLREALGRQWAYVDPSTVEVGCVDSGLKAPVQMLSVSLEGVRAPADVRSLKSPDGARRECSEVTWELPGPPLEVGRAMAFARSALTVRPATLEEAHAHRTPDETWAYRVRMCTGDPVESDAPPSEIGVQGDKAYLVEIPSAVVRSTPAWLGTNSKPPLDLPEAIDLGRARAQSQVGHDAAVTHVELRRVYENHWVYFVWAQPGAIDARPNAGFPIGIAMSRATYGGSAPFQRSPP